jgi:membrane protein
MARTFAARGVPARADGVPRSESTAAARQSGGKAKLLATRARLERHAWFRVLESTARGFIKDRVTSYAAAMVYYGLFSLFPLLLLFMSLAGLALQSNEAAREQIMAVVTGLLPQGEERLKDVIEGVIDAKGVAAGIGILTLLWGALGWFQVIDNNVNQIWGVDKKRSFIKGKLFALAMVAAIGGVALASWVATAAIGLLVTFTDVIPGSVLLWQGLVSLLSVLTIAAAFYVLYRYTPRRPIEFADVWPAALATAVLWEAIRRLLAFYLEKNNMISGYGPIGAAMALLFWIYVASIIILLGAELAYAIAKERRHIGPEQEMWVIAPPGEQPTPKFAPQVGTGFESADEQEPIRAAAAHSVGGNVRSDGREQLDAPSASPNHYGSRAGVADGPLDGSSMAASAEKPGVVKNLLWMGLSSGTVAVAGLLARRAGSGIWKVVMREPPPTSKV